MTYEFQGKTYDVEYEVDDLSEHCYNIWLVDENGGTIDSDQLPSPDQMSLFDMVDGDAMERAIDNAEWGYDE